MLRSCVTTFEFRQLEPVEPPRLPSRILLPSLRLQPVPARPQPVIKHSTQFAEILSLAGGPLANWSGRLSEVLESDRTLAGLNINNLLGSSFTSLIRSRVWPPLSRLPD